MICAIVNDNVVQVVRDVSQDEFDQGIANLNQAVISIDGLLPQPDVGWIFDGANLSSPVPSTKISKLSMIQRFTVPERLGILTYIQSNPASVPAILVQNIMLATYVDLGRPDTQAGVNYLVSFSLITSLRATAILTTPPTYAEIYKGNE